MKEIADERVQLVKIHIAKHCVELAAKEAIDDSKFQTVDYTYKITFGLMKNSGKYKVSSKRYVKKAKTFNILHPVK